VEVEQYSMMLKAGKDVRPSQVEMVMPDQIEKQGGIVLEMG